ncbi:hypothetical protein ACHAWF_016418, partial [Thalassiosira exigua]
LVSIWFPHNRKRWLTGTRPEPPKIHRLHKSRHDSETFKQLQDGDVMAMAATSPPSPSSIRVGIGHLKDDGWQKKQRSHHEQLQMEHEGFDETAHASSNHFCFNRDECGHLTKMCIVDRLAVMTENDRELYDYNRFLPACDKRQYSSPRSNPNPTLIVDPDWRASIIKWVRFRQQSVENILFIPTTPHPLRQKIFARRPQSYKVVDHFELSREVVALSALLFDRFFATGVCRPSSDMVLLASIATLHIAIKVREAAIIKLSTLSWFGRGKFSEDRIHKMESLILSNLHWSANPPTAISFVMHLLLLLPASLDQRSKANILESSRFMAGKTMCNCGVPCSVEAELFCRTICRRFIFRITKIFSCRSGGDKELA